MRPLQPPPIATSGSSTTPPLSSSSSSSNCKRQRRRLDLSLPLSQRDPNLAIPLTPTSSSSSCSCHYLTFYELERINRIGSSSGSAVYKVLHRPTGKLYALKVIHGNHEDSVRLEICREIEILRNFHNPNVVRCHDVNDHNGQIQVLLEYMDKGSLEGIHIPDEPSLSDVTRQILSGLFYLHKRKIIHRDIKPSNLLINSKRDVKVADFGFSRVLAEMDCCYLSMEIIGYMCPERINTDLNLGKNCQASSGDIWSLGVSILELYLGRFPFAARKQDWDTLMREICMSEPPEAPQTASREFREFIACCLQKDPAKRRTAAQLLRHPFILRHSSPSSSLTGVASSTFTSDSSTNNQNQVLDQTRQLLPPSRPQFSSS